MSCVDTAGAILGLYYINSMTFNASPMFVFVDGNYLDKKMPSLEQLVEDNDCFTMNAETGGVMMSINDPLAQDACQWPD